MTSAAQMRARIAVAGGAVALAVHAIRDDRPPAAPPSAAAKPPCSGCDARHARLREARIDLTEVRE